MKVSTGRPPLAIFRAILGFAAALFFGTPSLMAEDSDWQGYRKRDFTVDGRAALLVRPVTPAPGNPWIWRTEFFGHEPPPADHPLRFSPNTLLASHTAWYSAGSVPQLQRKAAEEIVRGLRGEKAANIVNGVTTQNPLS